MAGEAEEDGLAFAVRRGGSNQPAPTLEGAVKCCGSWWEAVPLKRAPPDPVWGSGASALLAGGGGEKAKGKRPRGVGPFSLWDEKIKV